MKPVFLDASGLIAVANTDDHWHECAQTVWNNLFTQKMPLVTTSLVLFELGDGLARVGQRALAIELYDRLCRSPLVRSVFVGPEQTAVAWDLFRDRPDKTWGERIVPASL
jgi:predicted nucleic acid-binding protein